MGEALVQRTTVPVPDAPDSCCVVVGLDDGGYMQHYFDSRGVVRLYGMAFDGSPWTLERTKPDFTLLEFHQRFTGAPSPTIAPRLLASGSPPATATTGIATSV
jgi:hypothetical protein